MSGKETERLSIMENLKARRIKQKDAAKILGITTRQVRRIFTRYQTKGVLGLLHKSRGKVSNRAIDQQKKDCAITLIKKYYPDFGPTFAQEKLEENHRIKFGVTTLRREMIKQKQWKPRRRKIKSSHPYRERRANIGELIQLDGSPHKWFEGRGKSCTLLAFIDDATSKIMDGEFVNSEGTFTFFSVTQHYLETHGKPLALYVDKHSTFKVNRQADIEEELRDSQEQSQFARAMDQLRIKLIFAHSPQAKGRVERLFETLQDRLVKEMRLAKISNKKEGTRYFREVYIPKHNSKFSVMPREKGNLHRPLLPEDNLSLIFTRQSQRVVSKNLLVQYKNIRYQLKPPNGHGYTLRNVKITVLENKQAKVTLKYKNREIPYTIAVQEPVKRNTKQVASVKSFNEKQVYIPAADHPWRRFKI